jgi:hypothetical protein
MPQALPADKQTKYTNRIQRRPKLAHSKNNHNTKERQRYTRVERKASYVVVRRHGMCLERLLHLLILFGSGAFVPACSKVSNAFGAKWVGSFVRCSAGGAFQGRVGAGFPGATGEDRTGVVFGVVLLCADGAGRFLRFAELGVVTITLTVTAVGVGGPREVFRNAAHAVMDSETGCTKTF